MGWLILAVWVGGCAIGSSSSYRPPDRIRVIRGPGWRALRCKQEGQKKDES
jgi:hypothetical protein